MLEVSNRLFRESRATLCLPYIPPLPLSVSISVLSYAIYHAFLIAFFAGLAVGALAIAYNDIMYEYQMDEYRARLEAYREQYPEHYYATPRRSERLRKIEAPPCYKEVEETS